MGLSIRIKLASVVVVIFFVFSCKDEKGVIYSQNKNDDITALVYHRYEYELSDIYVTSDTVDWIEVVGKSENTFEYDYFKEASKYQLTFKEEGNFLIKNQDTLELYLEGEKLFALNGTKFSVYKFLESPLTVDGCVTHFVSPKYGMLIKKSPAWRSYTELSTSVKDCKELISVLKNENDYYMGCFKGLNELSPPKPDLGSVPN